MTDKEYEELVNSFRISDRVEIVRRSNRHYGEQATIYDIGHDSDVFRVFKVKFDSGWYAVYYAEDMKRLAQEEHKNV